MSNPVPLAFPLGGINENAPYSAPPGQNSVRSDHVLNVRPHDALERRARGGQRTGISKYLTDAVDGTNPIQAISSGAISRDPASVTPDVPLLEEDWSSFSVGDLPADGADYYEKSGSSSNFFGTPTHLATLESEDGGLAVSLPDPVESRLLGRIGALTLGDAYIVQANIRFRSVSGSGPSNPGAGFALHLRIDTDSLVGGAATTTVGVGGRIDTNGEFQLRYTTGGGAVASQLTGTNLGDPVTVNTVDEYTLTVSVQGNNFVVSVGANEIGSFSTSNLSQFSGVGLELYSGNLGGTNRAPYVRDFEVIRAIAPVSLYTRRLVVVSGGDIRLGDRDGLALASSGTGAVSASGIVQAQTAFQNMFFCDGVTGSYVYLELTQGSVSDWATDVTDGALPVGTVDSALACSIITLYRGRIVMAGLREEPQNWFMSKSGDPFNWDYAPATTNPTQAVAGNNSNAGELGDVLTALMPYQDDLLFFGGIGSLWVLRGDPAAGGQIDNISRQIGVVGPSAWTWDTGGTLYFFGQNGLYRMSAGSMPELISRGKLDKTFSEVDADTNHVTLVYDRGWQGVHIFIAPENEPEAATDHWFWDERTNSFWRDQYPTNIGPTAVHLYDADNPDDRGVLLGGYDSYVRFFDAAVHSDDGTAITSFLTFPMLHPQLPQGQFQMTELQMHTDSAGDALTLEVFRGHTPEAAAKATTAAMTRTLAAGRNLPIRKHLRANALMFRLGQSTLGETWAYEAGTVMIDGVGRQRARL